VGAYHLSVATGDDTVGVHDPTISADESAGGSGSVRPSRPDLPDGVVVGRYITTGVVGRGGMGTVYSAHDPVLRRQVALKLLHSEFPASAERLIREAQALAKLHHPNVVAVYDAGELEPGQVFIAMQLVDGQDLATILASNQRPTRTQLLEWFVAAGRGLAAAHAAGLVHRDFKPANVIVDRDGRVAVTDFGLAREARENAERRLTALGVIAGTPAYMAPEQHEQQPATQASDQFAFCVSLWEALFDRHPFVEGDRDSLSPVAIGFAIYDAPLIPPPRVADVPRHVVDALMRGLERNPEMRWPSMNALLAMLAPPAKRRRWPLVLAAGLVGAGAATTAVFALGANDTDDPPCVAQARERAHVAWSPEASAAIAKQFAAGGKPYAAQSAQNASGGLDRYAARWEQLSADACLAAPRSTDELAARRRACLDARLDALRTTAGVLATEKRPELVDRAQQVIDGLPALDDCADDSTLLAGPGVPPATIAQRVAALDVELATATARGNGGAYDEARGELTTLAKQADALAWPGLQSRAHLALGISQLRMLMPAREELLRAAELATATHQDREAARAWAAATTAAGFEKAPDAAAAIAVAARAAAARVGDKRLAIQAEVAYGRAQVRLRDYKGGADRCRAALVAAKDLDGHTERDSANDCLVEALVPLGAYAELEPLLAQLIADRGARFGGQHPMVSDFIGVQIDMDLRHGQLAKAHANADRIYDIRVHAYPPGHMKIAEALKKRAEVAEAENKLDDARVLYEQALAIAVAAKPEPLVMINGLHTSLGFMAASSGDRKKALEHFEQAAELTRSRVGPDSLEYAFVLLNYGQVKAEVNLDQGIGLLGEALAILERAHDKRAATAGATLAMVLIRHDKWADARKIMEDALAHVDADNDPEHIAQMKWVLARALLETKGDRKKAKQLAKDARAVLANQGPHFAKTVEAIDEWLAKH
jgi:eukaryotic-like serine/threonine-protein kinase